MIDADQEDRSRREQGAEPPVLAGLVERPVLGRTLLAVGERLAGVEEDALRRRQVRRRSLTPLEGVRQAPAAVQLALGAAHGVPGVGGATEVAQDSLALDVLVEPAPQAGPGPRQRLVGELDHTVVAGDEPGSYEQLDELIALGVGSHGSAGHPESERLPVGARCYQAQQQVAQQRPLLGGNLLVERLGRLGHRTADAAGGAIAVHGERSSLAALPGRAQGMRQQREGTRCVLHVLHQKLDQAGLEQEPGLMGRSLDGRPQIGLAHRTEQIQTGFDQAGKHRVGGQLSQTVGPQRHHQRSPLGVQGQSREEAGLLAGVVAQGDCLLALVHDQRRSRARDRHRSECVHRMGSRRHHHHPATVALERGNDTSPQQRRLAAAGRSHDRQHPDRAQPAQALRYLGVAAEEGVGVGHVVWHQPQIWAAGAGLGQGRVSHQRGVLAQDRLLQGDQLGPGVHAQLARQHRAGLMQGPQRFALPAGLVLRKSQQGPAPLPQGGLGHPRVGLGQHVAVAARPQRRIQQHLLGVQAQLFQPSRLDPPRMPALQLHQRSAPPQRQPLTDHMRRSLGLPQGEQLPAPLHQSLEALGVHLLDRQDQPVALGHRLDRLDAEHLAQPRHAPVDHLGPCRRRLLTPQGVGQLLCAHGSPGRNASVANTTRSRGPRPAASPSTLTGPNTATPTQAVFAPRRYPSTSLLPRCYPSGGLLVPPSATTPVPVDNTTDTKESSSWHVQRKTPGPPTHPARNPHDRPPGHAASVLGWAGVLAAGAAVAALVVATLAPDSHSQPVDRSPRPVALPECPYEVPVEDVGDSGGVNPWAAGNAAVARYLCEMDEER